MNWLAVFIGGGLGSLCRYGISVWSKNWDLTLPVGTLVSNLLASLILAIVVVALQKSSGTSQLLYLMLVVGFCGGFSTFSTFSLETFELFRQNMIGWALLNIFISVTICVGVIWILAKIMD
jgi:CrcB protein